MKAGATPTARAIDVTLAHWELAPIQALLQAGHPMTAPIAAALWSCTDRLEGLLREASAEEIQKVFGMAVINRQVEAARRPVDPAPTSMASCRFMPTAPPCTRPRSTKISS